MRQLELLSKIVNRMEPLLAIPSLSTFQDLHDHSDTVRVEACPTDRHVRLLTFPPFDQSAIKAVTSDDGFVSISVSDGISLPPEYDAALAALGGSGKHNHAVLDADEFDRRMSALDAAYCLMIRLPSWGVPQQAVIDVASKILLFAARLGRLRALLFDAQQTNSSASKAWARLTPSWLKSKPSRWPVKCRPCRKSSFTQIHGGACSP